jgi:SEC-C motif-containing protein
MSGHAYAACCGPVHADIRAADTPEQVVRARFSAQVLGDMDFFRQSITRKHRNLPHVDAFAETIGRRRYERIAITDATRLGWFNRKATVVCRIYDAGRRHVSVHTERIHLKREDRAWRVVAIDLVTAQSSPGTARNAPCPCGSGKKYKRCCGNHENALPKATTDCAA